jgi:hypothetical protein
MGSGVFPVFAKAAAGKTFDGGGCRRPGSRGTSIIICAIKRSRKTKKKKQELGKLKAEMQGAELRPAASQKKTRPTAAKACLHGMSQQNSHLIVSCLLAGQR